MWAITARPDDPARYCGTGQSGRLKYAVIYFDRKSFLDRLTCGGIEDFFLNLRMDCQCQADFQRHPFLLTGIFESLVFIEKAVYLLVICFEEVDRRNRFHLGLLSLILTAFLCVGSL